MKFSVIGVPDAAEYFEQGGDPCFGKYYAKTAPECVMCVAPVVIDGKVRLMRDVCAARSKGAENTVDLERLTSRDVAQRIERGEPLHTIFAAILGDAPPEIAASAARQILVDRLLYLKSTGARIPEEVPRVKELLGALKK